MLLQHRAPIRAWLFTLALWLLSSAAPVPALAQAQALGSPIVIRSERPIAPLVKRMFGSGGGGGGGSRNPFSRNKQPASPPGGMHMLDGGAGGYGDGGGGGSGGGRPSRWKPTSLSSVPNPFSRNNKPSSPPGGMHMLDGDASGGGGGGGGKPSRWKPISLSSIPNPFSRNNKPSSPPGGMHMLDGGAGGYSGGGGGGGGGRPSRLRNPFSRGADDTRIRRPVGY